MKKRIVLITAVCVIFIGVLMLVYAHGNMKEVRILEAHRRDFTEEIAPEIRELFVEAVGLKKVYLLLTNEWYLAEELSDFSQVVTTDIVYVAEDVENGYSFYKQNEEGELEWSSSAHPPADAVTPFGFYGLSDKIIEEALGDIQYEDYIFTYLPRLHTVFVWVRGEEDFLVTYPTRPDLLGLEVGGVYTLDEVRELLVKISLEKY